MVAIEGLGSRDQPALAAANLTYPPGISPPLTFIDDHDQSGAIAVISGFSLGLVLLSAVIRIFTRRHRNNGVVQYNDYAFFIGVAVAVAQSVLVCVSISMGLGKAVNLLEDDQLSRISTLLLASDVLYIFVLFLSKAACSLMFLWLSPIKPHKKAARIVLALSVAWFMSSVFLEAFRCPEDPLTPNKCNGFFARRVYIGVFDMVIEIALILTSVYLVWERRMFKQAKLTVIGAFSCRILNIVLTITRLVFLNLPFTVQSSPYWVSRVFSTTQLAAGYTIMSYVIVHVRALIQAYEPRDGASSKASNSTNQPSTHLRKPSEYLAVPPEGAEEGNASDGGHAIQPMGQRVLHVTQRIDFAHQQWESGKRQVNRAWVL